MICQAYIESSSFESNVSAERCSHIHDFKEGLFCTSSMSSGIGRSLSSRESLRICASELIIVTFMKSSLTEQACVTAPVELPSRSGFSRVMLYLCSHTTIRKADQFDCW